MHEVIAAITTEPWLSSYSEPLKLNLVEVANLSYAMLNPLKPTGAVRHDWKSFCMLTSSTLSWGLFGPARFPLTVDRSNSMISPE